MSAVKENTCNKFQANIFNKSKCQNCFKPRESHLLGDDDFTQAKPIYGGWLLLAPEGTDFSSPLQRSRKWQRRFFLLYEHGLLRYALDEMASTLPQGTINLNVCVDVVDGENVTGQKHSLCICTPDKEHYIRAESRDIINGWLEALIVFPQTNKQNQKKKRKVEPPTPQEPGPAKVAVTSSGALCVSNSGVQSEGAEPVTGSERVNGGRKPRVESGYFSLEKPKPEAQQPEHNKPVTSSSSSRLRYSTSDPALFVSSSSHNTHTHDTHTAHTDLTDSPTHTSEGRTGSSTSMHTSHSPLTNTQASPLSSSQSSLDSETSPERRGRADTVGGDARSQARGIKTRLLRDGRSYAALSDVPRARRLNHRAAFRSDEKRQEIRARTRSPGREEVERLFGHQRRRTQVIERFETQQSTDFLEHMDTTESSSSSSKHTSQRTGRSDRRFPSQKQDLSLDSSMAGSVTDFSGKMDIYRRAKSLDRRVTESSMTPDLLNFKKGWMTKLYEDGLWKKHWFVLTDQSLRYYRDSIAEEAADLDGEIDLSTCYDVTEFPVQRNYGFQIHSKEGVFTLSAMTSGIRRNWIQAIMKCVRPTITPDVTRSVSDENAKSTPSPPDASRSSHSWKSCDVIADSSQPPDRYKPRPRDRRREGRSKTFDWAEFQNKRAENLDISSSPSPSSVSSSASSPSSSHSDRKLPPQEEEVDSAKGRVGAASETPSADINSEVQVEIEQRWHQVETTPLREEKQVPITGGSAHFSTKEKIPTQEFTALPDKEAQKELVRLQEQNTLLQEQLHDAQHTAREGYVLQETCERGFAAMEETHQKVIEDLQRQHQREINKLLEERERLLEEETNATIAAIEAMKNAHREELEKTQRAQLSGDNADIEELRIQYEEELQSIHRELEVLSEQYSQKCLENSHLAQALEAERQALQQCQRENQQLHTHNQELNNRLTVEINRMRSCLSGEKPASALTQGKDLYELEVLLRIKESEIQYLKQEINSLKDELQSALRDKKYACDKYKDIYTELSIVRAKADCDISKLRDKLLAATEAFEERDASTHGYDIMKSKSNPDFLKKERSGLSKQVRGVRSKSLKEGLTVQERMKLFEAKDSRKI
ncbi:myosin phosphatase Rho-interacting protein isoform X8 [Trichomycterus rosablanca]|uniref:myosin phosphatase Rho-interacting protein isoform X8 n=1 Tax=Trichomycterus rosablanca TaxID=2290929 RepID=UPI002F357171